MDINDFNSPLRGLINSPARKFTPAVPTPDWANLDSVIRSTNAATAGPTHATQQPSTEEIKNGMKRPYPYNAEPQKPSASTHQSVIQSTADYTFGSVLSSSTAPQIRSTHRETYLQSPDPRKVTQDVPVTPSSAVAYDRLTSSVNPHASMSVATPVVSGPTQAKHSIKIQNCVSTVNSDCELNLLQIYQKTRFSEYNPSRFHGLIMRIREPKTTALIFSSGKMVCTGARNEHDSCLAVTKFIRIVEKVGFPVRMLDFKIQNFVATADLRFPIRLELLHQSHGQFSSYEPEMFPGLVYRMVRPRMVLLIFVNGKIVFTGAKSRNEIEECLDIIYPILRSFKKN